MTTEKEKTMLCFSGGKNSTALLLRLVELGKIPDKIVFADTLFEFPEMYAFIDKVEIRKAKGMCRNCYNYMWVKKRRPS